MSFMGRTSKRDKSQYRIDSLSKSILVLEAVEGGEPVPFRRIVERTGFSEDFVRRSLITWELHNYVRMTGNNCWIYDRRLLSFALSAGL